MDGLFLLVLIGGVIFAIVHVSKSRAAAKKAWAEVARTHRLDFDAGGMFAGCSIRGIHDGYRVTIDVVTRGGGKNSKTYTRYRVHYASLGNGMRLTREVPIVSAVGKMFGGQDIEVGNADFDDKVIVRGTREAVLRAYLTPARQRAIERFLSSHKHAVITERNATYETAGLESRGTALEKGLRLLVDLAGALVPDDAPAEPPAPPTTARSGSPRAQERAAAAGLATALGLAIETQEGRRFRPHALDESVDEEEGQDEDDDWTLPPAPAPAPVPTPRRAAPPARSAPTSAPKPAPSAPPQPVAPKPPAPTMQPPVPPAVPAPDPIGIGSVPGMPEVPSIAPEPAAITDTDAEPAVVRARQQDVCEALFSEDGGLSRAREIFEEQYAGLFVHWSGEMRSARHYYSDLVFGSEPGTRVELMVAKVASGILGEREIIAVVQLPDGADAELATRVGEAVTIEGDLASVDPFMRQVFVRNATLV